MTRCKDCGKLLTSAESELPCPSCQSMDREISDFNQGRVIEAARALARKHFEIEEGLTHIFEITDTAAATVAQGPPIKLLEVNENTSESGIMPLYFGPAPASGIPYASVIIEVSPAEFQKIQSHELKLPDGWAIGEELPRTSAAGAT